MAARLGVEVFSTSPPPCKTAAQGSVRGLAREKKTQPVTYIDYLLGLAGRVYSQNLYRNVLTAMFSFPHIREPTLVQRVVVPVIADGDF